MLRQSNMQFSMNGEERAKELIQASANKQILVVQDSPGMQSVKDDVKRAGSRRSVRTSVVFCCRLLVWQELHTALGGAIGLIDTPGAAPLSPGSLDQLRRRQGFGAMERKDLRYLRELRCSSTSTSAYDEWLKSRSYYKDFARNAPAQDAKWVENQRLSQRTFNGDGIVWFKVDQCDWTAGEVGLSISLGQFGAPVATYIDGKWRDGSKHSTAVAAIMSAPL